jgi:cupin 2 domain-containing protein
VTVPRSAAVTNLFDDLPTALPAERLDVLLSAPGLRVERIVSTGHVTPPGDWYDQDTDEWVVVLRGRARLRIDGEADVRDLLPGDHVLLRAHVRHRVEWTDPAVPTVWLAVHYGAATHSLRGAEDASQR